MLPTSTPVAHRIPFQNSNHSFNTSRISPEKNAKTCEPQVPADQNKKAEIRKTFKTNLLSDNITDTHKVICASSIYDKVTSDILANMIDSLQCSVYQNILNYARSGKKSVVNVIEFLMSLPMSDLGRNGNKNGHEGNKENACEKIPNLAESVFKNSLGLEKLLYYLSSRLFISVAEDVALEDEDNENENDHDEFDTKILTFFETYMSAKLPCINSSVPFILLKLFQLYNENGQMKVIDSIYQFRKTFKFIDWSADYESDAADTNDDQTNRHSSTNKLSLKNLHSLAINNLKTNFVQALINEQFLNYANGRDILARIIIEVDENLRKVMFDLMIRNVIDSKVKLGEVYGQIGVKCFKIASEFTKNKSGKDANGHVPTKCIPDLAKTQEIEKYKSVLTSIEEYLIQEVMEISCYVSVEVIFKEFKDFLRTPPIFGVKR